MWIKGIHYRRKRQQLNLDRGIGLILIFALVMGLFAVLVHYHGALYSGRVCVVCVTGPDTIGEVEDSFQEITDTIPTFLNHDSDPDSKSGQLISTLAIRAPPLA